MLNSKYTYMMSVEDIEATATKHSDIVYLGQHRFPYLRKGSRFTDRNTNLLKATSTIRSQGKSAQKNVLDVLRAITYYSASVAVDRMASMTVKPEKLCPVTTSRINGYPVIADYPKLKLIMKSVRHFLPSMAIDPLASVIESTQQGMSAYVHSHSLLLLGTITDCKAIQDTLNSYLSGSGFKAVVQPFDNHGHSTSYAVSRFIKYMYKQYKLPVAYDKHGQPYNARQAFVRWSALTTPQRKTFIEAIENSTSHMQLRWHVSYKRFINQLKATVCRLALLGFMLRNARHGYRVASQARAVADNRYWFIDHDRWASHRKHQTSLENWKIAQGCHAYSDDEPQTRQMTLEPAVRQHSSDHAVIRLIITVRAVSAVQYIIGHQINKNATSKSSDGNNTYSFQIQTTVQQLQISRHKPT